MVKKTGAKIVIHEEDAKYLVQTPADLLTMFRAAPSPPADLLVKEGDVIQVGNVGLKVIHTPGHSPGGMSLYMDGMVFTGDTLFVGSVGRTDFPGSSWDVMETSIRKKLYVLPGETIVFPGHNYGPTPSSTIQYEKRHNPFVRGKILILPLLSKKLVITCRRNCYLNLVKHQMTNGKRHMKSLSSLKSVSQSFTAFDNRHPRTLQTLFPTQN